MQVSAVETPVVRRVDGPANGLILTVIENLGQISSQTQSLREARQEDRLSERRRRDAEQALDPSQAAIDARRQVESQQRAVQRDELRSEAGERDLRQRKEFRRALADAKVQQRGDGEPAASRQGQSERSAGAAGERAHKSAPRAASELRESRLPDDARRAPETNPKQVEPKTTRSPAALRAAEAPPPTGPTQRSQVREANGPRASGRVQAALRGGAGRPGGSAVRGSNGVASADSNRNEALRGARSTARSGKTETAKPAERKADIERIVRFVRARIGRDHSSATLRLDPPELGRIRLHLELREQTVRLRVETHTPLAHRLLSEEAGTLRAALEASGLQLERFEVRPPGETPQGTGGDVDEQTGDHTGEEKGSAAADAEHSPERQTDLPSAQSVEVEDGGDTSEPATESRVNLIA